MGGCGLGSLEDIAVGILPYQSHLRKRGFPTVPISSGGSTQFQRRCASRFLCTRKVAHTAGPWTTRFTITTSYEWTVSLTCDPLVPNGYQHDCACENMILLFAVDR